MFDDLIESKPRGQERKNKVWFSILTVISYGLVFAGIILHGVWFSDPQIENQNLELVTLIAPIPITMVPPTTKTQEAKPSKVDPKQTVDRRRELIADVRETTLVPKEPGIKASEIPPVRQGVTTVISGENSNAVLPTGPTSGTGQGTGPARVEIKEDPPPLPTPTPKPRPTVISGGVMNGKAVSLPKPNYPSIARSAHASGKVVVRVQIDEQGKVTSAQAISGHPLLQAVSVEAARQAKFTPTLLSGVPVKVNGEIVYNFLPQ